MRVKGLRTLVATAVLCSGACTVHQSDPLTLSGPSEMAISLEISATPDHLTEDGRSSATITIRALGINGEPIPNLELRLQTVIDNTIVNYGLLSPTTVFTNSTGRASATFTPPLAPPFLAGGPGRVVSVAASTVGTNFSVSSWLNRTVELLVTPPPAPVQVPGAPVATVRILPSAAKVNQMITFDGSASYAEAGHRIVSWFWDFGDGLPNEEHGNDASHVYVAPGTYYMVLGVTDELGRTGSSINTIVVSP